MKIKNVKKCIICGKEFECYAKIKSRQIGIIRRPYRSLTCSKACARKNVHRLGPEAIIARKLYNEKQKERRRKKKEERRKNEEKKKFKRVKKSSKER